MPSISYKAVGIAQLTEWVNKKGPVLVKVQNDIMQQIIQETVQYMQSKAPVDTGYMRANVRGRTTGKGSGIIESTAYYSGFVNFGTRYMDAQPFFSDGIDYIKARVQRIIQDQLISQLRNK